MLGRRASEHAGWASGQAGLQTGREGKRQMGYYVMKGERGSSADGNEERFRVEHLFGDYLLFRGRTLTYVAQEFPSGGVRCFLFLRSLSCFTQRRIPIWGHAFPFHLGGHRLIRFRAGIYPTIWWAIDSFHLRFPPGWW